MDFLLIFKFSVLLQVVVAESESDEVGTRIANGNPVYYGSTWYQGYLSYAGEYYCGGSIIHQRWALTAAHCIDISMPYPTFTVGTIYKYGSDGVTHEIDFYIAHPNYQTNPLIYDIGLLHLTSDIQFNDHVNAIPLAWDTTANYDNRLALFAGWGIINQNGQLESASVMQYAYLPIMPSNECKAFFNSYLYNDLHLCGSNMYRQQGCPGDSGSPLVIDSQQIGIASYSVLGCDGEWPTVFTKVSTFRPWIQSSLAAYNDYI